MYIIFISPQKKSKLDPKGMAAWQRWYRMSLAVIETEVNLFLIAW